MQRANPNGAADGIIPNGPLPLSETAAFVCPSPNAQRWPATLRYLTAPLPPLPPRSSLPCSNADPRGRRPARCSSETGLQGLSTTVWGWRQASRKREGRPFAQSGHERTREMRRALELPNPRVQLPSNPAIPLVPLRGGPVRMWSSRWWGEVEELHES